jgi:predicted enzyme related to lactoylglutathione lyase
MANNIKLVVYPEKDLTVAKKFFNAYLGFEPYAESDYYVGYRTGDMEIGLDPHGQDVVAYVDVEDVKKSLQMLLDAGATTQQDVKDVGGGLLIAQVKDAGGNVLGLRQKTK